MRALMIELITYLRHRHAATLDLMEPAFDAVRARDEAAEERYSSVSARVDATSEVMRRMIADVESLRSLTEELRSRLRVVASNDQRNVLLRVEDLSKEIGGADILTDINFEIYEHEILGLIGPNGAGKTTLMECLANIRPRTSGTFYLGDVVPPDWDPRQLLFYLPNGVAPYAEMYTLDILTLFGRMFEVEPSRWESIVGSQLSLLPVLQKKVGQLSKGNLQRLLIALALMSPQPLLALDEPFDGLDVHQTQAMMEILRNLRVRGRTLLLCIHQLNDAERICDRLLLLDGGRMVGLGTLEELRAQAGLEQGGLEDVFLALTSVHHDRVILSDRTVPFSKRSVSS
jgi:ABC-type multidrug transport system ATPase subunit